jgi:O-antigen/teichoic acid export membrane protein
MVLSKTAPVSESLAHNTLYGAIASLSIVLGGFLSNVLAARLLGVEAAGIIAFATWAITVGAMVGDLGAPGALARYLPDLCSRGLNDSANGLVRWLSRVNLAGATVICLGFLAFAFWTTRGAAGIENVNAPAFWTLVACACLLQTVAALSNGYLKGTRNFALLARLALTSAILQMGATIAGALTFGALGALAGAIAAGIAPALMVRRFVRVSGEVPSELKRRVRRFALESWVGYLVTGFAWARMEVFFLHVSWGSQSVALFSASVTLANLATQGPLLLTSGLLPYLSGQQPHRVDRTPQATYATGMRLLAFLIFPACLGAAAISPALVPAIYGRGFSGAVLSTIVLLCGATVTASSSVAFIYLLAMERTRFVVATGGVAALAVIACGVTLVPIYGVMAAAIARAVIQASTSIVTIWYLGRYLDCPTPIADLARIGAAALICAGAASVCITWVQGPVGIAVAVPAGACVYGVAARLLGILPKRDAERLSNALAMLPRPMWIPATRALRLIAPSLNG